MARNFDIFAENINYEKLASYTTDFTTAGFRLLELFEKFVFPVKITSSTFDFVRCVLLKWKMTYYKWITRDYSRNFGDEKQEEVLRKLKLF